MRPNQLEVERGFVFVIDLQDSLLPLIRNHERVIASTRKLLEGIRPFELPVLATEQYPRGLGCTNAEVQRCLDAHQATMLEKMTFSSCGVAGGRKAPESGGLRVDDGLLTTPRTATPRPHSRMRARPCNNQNWGWRPGKTTKTTDCALSEPEPTP